MQEMHPSAMSPDSDFYRLSADDGPVWWLRGDPQCEPAWHPIEVYTRVRVDPRRGGSLGWLLEQAAVPSRRRWSLREQAT